MDLKLVIGFIYIHYILIFGTTLALFFTSCMILMIRSIGNKSESEAAAPVDVDAIEGAMRRVLQSQPVSIAAGSKIPAAGAAGAGAGSGEIVVDADAPPAAGSAASEEELAARDTKIAELLKELDTVRLALNANDGDDPAKTALRDEIAGLKSKYEEAQARLSEYEIIEDDIADLSMFKDENAKLKKELENLKAQLASGPATPAAAAPTAPVESAAAEFVETTVPEVVAEAPAPAPPVTESAPKADKFELNADDDVMKEFAAAVDGIGAAPATPLPSAPVREIPDTTGPLSSQAEIDALLFGQALVEPTAPAEPEPAAAAPAAVAAVEIAVDIETVTEDPLAGSPDPDKMLSEVETLETGETAEASLDDILDTDKLLAEVDSLNKGSKTA